ncbi:MAG: hypothetical protein ABI980_05655 [Nitrospirota bacterium]
MRTIRSLKAATIIEALYKIRVQQLNAGAWLFRHYHPVLWPP